MEPRNDEPFDREAWRKLMGAATGAPTKEIDRRIQAEARRALVPRIGRWWLPASLAASLLLAVLLVQRQLADVGAPVAISETDVLAAVPVGTARDNAASAESELPAPLQEAPVAETPVPPPRMDLPNMELERPAVEKQSVPAEEAPAAQAPASPTSTITSRVTSSPPPEQQPVLRDQVVTVTGSRATADAASAPAPAPAAEQGESEAKSSGMLAGSLAKESYAETRTPEQWVKDIAALRASGHIQEADAELARFKSRYPDWLEQHQLKDP